jgi:protein-tyrosine phosphatase
MTPRVYWLPNTSRGKLAIVARPRGNDWLEDEILGLKQTGIDVLVSLLTAEENNELGLKSEEALSKQQGLTFISFPISDYQVPTSMNAFMKLVDKLDDRQRQGSTIGIHCRQSIGRSSLLAACLLAMSHEDVDECFRLIEESRGTAVPDTPEQKAWVRTFAREFVSQ